MNMDSNVEDVDTKISGRSLLSEQDYEAFVPGGLGMKLKVNNIFPSIQGEGVNMGKPSVFLRLGGCNLRCGFCDTKYAFNGEFVKHTDIINKILEYGIKHLIITGGEPMLQQDELSSIIMLLENRGFTFEVETNGTIEPNHVLETHVNLWNVSPKLSNSLNSEESRYKPKVIEYFTKLPNAWFKFVVDKRPDLKEIEEFIHKNIINRNRVILMPQATSVTEHQKKEWIVKHCLEKGYRYSPRLHIILWGNVKGK